MGIQDGLLGWASKFGWVRRPNGPSSRQSRPQKCGSTVRDCQGLGTDIIHLEGSAPGQSGASLEGIGPKPALRIMPTPGGSEELRNALYQYDLARWALPPTGGYLATQGATGAFQAIASAFINRGDPVVVCDPGCPMHSSVLGLHGAKIRPLGVTLNNQGTLDFDPSEMARVAPGARLLVLSQPNNPDGGLWSDRALDELKGWAKRKRFLVIVDESNADYIPLNLRNPLEWRSGWEGMALFVGSLSQSHAASGIRVGWVHGPGNLLGSMERVLHLNRTGVSWSAERTALRLLAGQRVSGDFLQRMTDTRTFAENQLQGLGMHPSPSKAGMFLWMPTWNLSVSSKNLAKAWKNSCQVSVAPGENFGPYSMGHIRLNLAVDQGQLFEGLSRLKAWSEGEMGLKTGTKQELSVRKAA